MLTNILQDIHLTQLKFQLSEFLSISQEDDREISFLWDDYQALIGVEMKALAISRYRGALKPEGPVDPDYEPSSQGFHDSS